MSGKETFKIWAPYGIKWTDWVRPVPFIAIDNNLNNEFYDFSIPSINYINSLERDTAFIIDLPSYNSIKEGIALAKLGYRPIPIFNGTNEQLGVISTTNNNIIGPALVWGALELKNIILDNNTSPVFLLDTNRMNRRKMDEGVFDNSWDIYHQDLPTYKYFLDNGINKIVIRSNYIQNDLNKILYKFQKNGVKILFTNGYDEPKEVILKKPKKEKF